MDEDLYRVMGVERTASIEEIRERYKLKAKMYHPDKYDQFKEKSQWDHATEMMRDLNSAWEVLKDPGKRAAYDQYSEGNIKKEYTEWQAPPSSNQNNERESSANPQGNETIANLFKELNEKNIVGLVLVAITVIYWYGLDDGNQADHHSGIAALFAHILNHPFGTIFCYAAIHLIYKAFLKDCKLLKHLINVEPKKIEIPGIVFNLPQEWVIGNLEGCLAFGYGKRVEGYTSNIQFHLDPDPFGEVSIERMVASEAYLNDFRNHMHKALCDNEPNAGIKEINYRFINTVNGSIGLYLNYEGFAYNTTIRWGLFYIKNLKGEVARLEFYYPASQQYPLEGMFNESLQSMIVN